MSSYEEGISMFKIVQDCLNRGVKPEQVVNELHEAGFECVNLESVTRLLSLSKKFGKEVDTK